MQWPLEMYSCCVVKVQVLACINYVNHSELINAYLYLTLHEKKATNQYSGLGCSKWIQMHLNHILQHLRM